MMDMRTVLEKVILRLKA